MKISLSTVCLTELPWVAALEAAAAAGYHAVEVLMIPGWVHLAPDDVPPGEFRATAERLGLEVVCLHGGCLSGESDAALEASMRYLDRLVRFARDAGVPMVNVNGGPRRRDGSAADHARAAARVGAALAEYHPQLVRNRVRLTLENHYGFEWQEVADYEALFAQLVGGEHLIGITLDTGHFTAAGVNMPAFVRRFARRIFHVHIKDHIGRESVGLGQGRTDNAAVIHALRRHGYDGYYSVEVEAPDRENLPRYVREGRPYLERILADAPPVWVEKPLADVAFVGCGTHSTENLYPMLRYSRARLVATCDLDRALAERNARVFGAPHAYTDLAALLDEQRLDGVLLTAAPQQHYELGRRILERGIPLFIEKPPGRTLAQAQELASIARANGTFLMVGYMKRFGLTYREIANAIAAGAFEPAVMHLNYSCWPWDDLREFLIFMAVHPIDLALSLFGPATAVTSAMYRSGHGAISLGLTLHFASGRWAQLTLDSSQARIQERLTISGRYRGSNAVYVVDNVDRIELHLETHGGNDLHPDLTCISPRVHLDGIQLWRPDHGIPNAQQTRHFFQGYAGEIREFVDAILEGRDARPSTEEGIAAMRIVEAILQRPDGRTDLEQVASSSG